VKIFDKVGWKAVSMALLYLEGYVMIIFNDSGFFGTTVAKIGDFIVEYLRNF
jgi:hypothetical protein